MGRLEFLSEFESIKSKVMSFGKDVNLKFIVDFSNKDKNGNKKKSYEEFRYQSDKYPNYSNLISASMTFDAYLVFEYPLSEGSNSTFRSNTIMLRPYMVQCFNMMVTDFMKCYDKSFIETKEGELTVRITNANTFVLNPSMNTTISFNPDVYVAQNGNTLYGVCITFNDEYSVRISYNKWMELCYFMSTCDLFGWGLTAASQYYSNLNGYAITEFNSNRFSNSTRGYEKFWYDNNK